MKRNRLEKLGDFVLGKGFYIVLFLCVAAIGISGYYLIRSVSGSEPAQEPVTANPSVTLPDSSAVFPGEQSHQPQPTPEPAAQPDDPQPKKDAETAAPAQPREVVYTWPVKGQVLRGFTVEALAYDETMGDWRTHGGIDIAAEEGRKVLAAGEGQVAEVYDDAMMGTTVTILQPDGVTAVYSNLAQKTAVAVGDLVDTGAVLGEVGRTALAESGLEPHLHLELLADGEPVNPLAYLPKLNCHQAPRAAVIRQPPSEHSVSGMPPRGFLQRGIPFDGIQIGHHDRLFGGAAVAAVQLCLQRLFPLPQILPHKEAGEECLGQVHRMGAAELQDLVGLRVYLKGEVKGIEDLGDGVIQVGARLANQIHTL